MRDTFWRESRQAGPLKSSEIVTKSKINMKFSKIFILYSLPTPTPIPFVRLIECKERSIDDDKSERNSNVNQYLFFLQVALGYVTNEQIWRDKEAGRQPVVVVAAVNCQASKQVKF